MSFNLDITANQSFYEETALGAGATCKRRERLRARLIPVARTEMDSGCLTEMGEEVPTSPFTQGEVGSNTTRDGEGIRWRDTSAKLMRSC
jgi:hypothetical protein